MHAKDLKSIKDAVAQMAADCGQSKLALVIMTHRHADHISGFATCAEIFSQFTVDRVWMPWFEDPTNKTAVAIQTNLTALAGRLSFRLAARGDAASLQFAAMVDNITGGMAAAGGVGQPKGARRAPQGIQEQSRNPIIIRRATPANFPRSSSMRDFPPKFSVRQATFR